MISDTERRKIAASLRESANVGGARTLKRELAKALGIRLDACTAEGSHTRILRGLADLIDRPKAKREDAGNYWRCGHCGAFSRKDAVTDCCGVIPSRCCGNCGREWEK